MRRPTYCISVEIFIKNRRTVHPTHDELDVLQPNHPSFNETVELTFLATPSNMLDTVYYKRKLRSLPSA